MDRMGDSFRHLYIILIMLLHVQWTQGLEVGPCFTKQLVDIDSYYYNSLLGAQLTGTGPYSYMDPSPSYSDPNHAFDVCYFAQRGFRHYFTAISSSYGYFYLVQSGSTSEFLHNSNPITNRFDQRLHVDAFLVQYSLSLYTSASSRRLYGTAPAVGYSQQAHWWYLMPYASQTGSGSSGFFITWGSGAGFRVGAASSINNAICRGLCETSKLSDERVISFRDNGNVVVRRRRALGNLDNTDFEVHRYTVYTKVMGGRLPNLKYDTREAVVIRERTTEYALTPRTNERNKLEATSTWSSAEGVTSNFTRMRAEDFSKKYSRFLAAMRKNQVLATNLKEQNFPDSRFFFIHTVGKNQYRLELVNHPGYYLAVLHRGKSKVLMVTQLAAEEANRITFIFNIKLPDNTSKPAPPDLSGTATRLINNNYNCDGRDC